MDWVIWTIVGIIGIGFIVGVYRGALRIIVSIAAAILTVFITVLATPYVAEIVEEKTPLDESIREYVVTSMAEATDSLLPIEETGTGLTKERVQKVLKAAGVSKKELKKAGITVEEIVNGDVKKEELKKLGVSSRILDGQRDRESTMVDELMENKDIPKDIQKRAINSSEFAGIFKKLLNDNNKKAMYARLGVETFAQYVGTYMAKLMIHVACFLAVFLLVSIILRAIIFALNIVNEIPGLGLLNRLAGGAAGALCGVVVVWLLCVLVTLFYSTDMGREIYETLQANGVTRIILENNPLLNISIKI